MNLANIVERSAFHFPDRPAVSSLGVQTTYRTLNHRINLVATALIKQGVSPGDRVALCAPNSLEWLIFYYGVIKAGAVAVTISSLSTPRELNQILTDCSPKCLFATEDKMPVLAEIPSSHRPENIICQGGTHDLNRLCQDGDNRFDAMDCDRNDTAAILFTGGTTGTPKGVMLSHENIYTAICNVVFNERSDENDRALCFLPFNHVFAQMHIMNATLLSGGCLELIPAFDMERVLEITSAGRVTKLYAVPTVYVRLLTVEDIRRKLGSVRYCFSAAASMAVEVVKQWRKKTNLSIYEAYGMTESASMVTYNHYHRHVVGSVGTPVGSTEIRILDSAGKQVVPGQEGEICIRGRNIMKGYLNRPEETRSAFRDDWFRSGDIGFVNENGYLFLVDRLKDLIITGGENVYPREIEEVLYSFETVEECAVIGLPDKEWGERVTAVIVPSRGTTVNVDALKAAMKKSLSAYKVPKAFHVVESLPKSAAGKIMKRTLKKEFC